MLPSVFDAAPTNSFLQNAHKKRFLQQGIPFPEEEENTAGGGLKPEASLMSKQKWKMLKGLPGKHSGNTWRMMGILNKGLSPMGKNADGSAVKEARVGLKTLALGGGALGAGGAGVYGANKINNTLNRQGDSIRRDVMSQVTPVLDSAKGAIAQGQQTMGQVQQATQSFQNAFKPWADMAGGLGRSLAGTFGMQGYARPQWQQNAANHVRRMYNKANDPETGVVGATTRYTQQQYQWLMDLFSRLFGQVKENSYTKEGGMTMLTTFDAVQTVLNGSAQFQKRASANTQTTPDTLLKAHFVFAEELEKCAEHFVTQEQVRSFAVPFSKAAGMVQKGYPAKAALYESLGRNKKLAEQTEPVLHQIAAVLLGREISKTYQKKAAAHLEKKKA